jgi:hypothetical protein
MQKLAIPLSDLSPVRPESKLIRIVSILVLGIALATLIKESAAICHGQWCQFLGSDAEVQTPIFVSLQDGVVTAHSSIWNSMAPWFQRVPWNPSIVLPIAVVVMVFGMAMLKF